MSEMPSAAFSEVTRIFSAMPGLQLVFLALAFVTWLAGANLVVAYHYKRVGKSAWSGFKPFASPPFRHFNAKEWRSAWRDLRPWL